MYDLTSLLTTIVSSSATLVAIVGGFIASKLIALNTERDELLERISEIEKEIDYKSKEVASARRELNEEDALDFIHDHVDDALLRKSLDLVYEAEDRPILSKEELAPYWDRAVAVIENLLKVIEDENFDDEFNDDGIPRSYAIELGDFEYKICESAVKCAQRKQREASRSSSPFGIELGNLNSEVPRITGLWYQRLRDDMNVQIGHLEWLKVQKNNCRTGKMHSGDQKVWLVVS